MQTLVVVLIVAGAAFLLGRSFLKSAREGTCPGGCGGCSRSGSCAAWRDPEKPLASPEEPGKEKKEREKGEEK